MKKFLFMLAGVLVAAAICALVLVVVYRQAHPRSKQKKAAEHKHVERNPAVMDPTLTQSLLSPAPTPEVKGAFDQKSRVDPSPSR
jgi:hypothetical protein